MWGVQEASAGILGHHHHHHYQYNDNDKYYHSSTHHSHLGTNTSTIITMVDGTTTTITTITTITSITTMVDDPMAHLGTTSAAIASHHH
jgi:hypothetical protein